MSNCYDQPPKSKRSPIAVAGDLITRCGDSLDVEAAKLLRDMHDELEELRDSRQAVADFLFADPHRWSKRSCPTCKKVTELLGVSFGCVRFTENEPDELT